jgi:hypothetical protein
MTKDEREEFQQYLTGLFTAVDEEAFQRHAVGAETYGPLKFVTADTLQEAYEELLDLINYARYTAVKVKMLQAFISEKAAAVDGTETTGAGTFLPTSEILKGFQEK